MKYETFDPEKHDLDKVAKLTYDVDFRTFDMLFKNPDDAVKAIEKDLADIPSGSKFAYSVWSSIPDKVKEFARKTGTDCVNMFANCSNLINVGSVEEYFELGSKMDITSIF
jgi:hypothetical protein